MQTLQLGTVQWHVTPIFEKERRGGRGGGGSTGVQDDEKYVRPYEFIG